MPRNNISKKKQNNLVKSETKLVKLRDKCRKTKCARELKERNKLHNSFEKEQATTCGHIKDNKKYYDCTSIFYDGSEYRKKYDEYIECSKKKCRQLNNSIKKIHHQQTMQTMQGM